MKNQIFLSLIISFFWLCTSAQQIELKQEDKNSFSFSTKDIVLIKDFRIDGPTYHVTDDPYQFTIIALTENGETDASVNGSFTFAINGNLQDVQFTNGEAPVKHELGKAETLHVQLAHTNLEKTIEVSQFGGTPALLGVAVFLLLTFLFRHQLARWFRKMFGKDKR